MVNADTAQRRRRGLLVLGACLLLAPGYGAAGTIKCWTGQGGIRECGSIVPPEYAQQRVELLNAQGRVIEVQEGALTPAERAAAAKRAEAEQAQARHREEQARLDRVLLDTFVSERDIERSRDDKLAAVEGGIKLTEGNLERQTRSREQLAQRAAQFEARSEPVPDGLSQDIQELDRQIDNNRRFIEAQRAEQARIRTQHQDYAVRFRELKGGGR